MNSAAVYVKDNIIIPLFIFMYSWFHILRYPFVSKKAGEEHSPSPAAFGLEFLYQSLIITVICQYLDQSSVLLIGLTSLVGNGAGGFAGRLTGGLAFSASALSGSFFKVSLINGFNVLHYVDFLSIYYLVPKKQKRRHRIIFYYNIYPFFLQVPKKLFLNCLCNMYSCCNLI